MSLAIEPVINKLRAGCLVEIHGLSEEELQAHDCPANGERGQLLGYDEGAFWVHLICGTEGRFDPKNVKAAENLAKPGEGGDERSFDLLVAPRTDSEGLGQELAGCVVSKGFSVLRVCQSRRRTEELVNKLRGLGEEGKLARLPEEVEEGYLGNTCRGKVAWLDPDDRDFDDEHLWSSDGILSHLASLFQPYAADVLGDFMEEKTPALVCLTLTDEEEPEYPSPEADDKVLGTFLDSWRRTLLRAVLFLGPSTAQVTLEAKDTDKTASVANLQSDIRIEAVPNTVLLFRPDIYELTCDAPEETLMLVSNFLTPAPTWIWDRITGDLSWLQEMEGPPPPPQPENIHILNSTCRLPANFDCQWSYYGALKAATDAVIKIPIVRGDVDLYFTSNTETFETWQTTCQHQSFCEGVEMFDNRHFEISNAEAASMDPVQRLILETGAHSLAMMGLTKKITNRKSVHAGCAVGNDKLDWAVLPKETEIGGAQAGTSTVLAIIANRFNFIFNMKGPSFVCDTACSASLTSTHCAKMMLAERVYDPLDWFLSVGAHLVLNAVMGVIGGTQSHMGGPIGRCLTFNASASGYLRGEGVSAIMMKWGAMKGSPDSDAILRATQVGQDGRSASLTAPNGPAQEEMVTRAIKEAQMTPPESTVWECHGTGTSLGDPIEVGAVRKVQIRMPRMEPLMITSNKTNIGHLEGGAAMAAMVKCVLQCKHAKCCSTLHLRTLNPHLEHAAFDAIFQTETACYAYVQGHSQVSSFGFGGTNAHGIFWGQNLDITPDSEKLFHKKLAERPPPEVRVMGNNPDDWEADFPDWRNVDRNAKWQVTMGPDDVGQPLRYEQVLDVNVGAAEEDEEATYSVTGNFNSWSEDRMAAGDVPGLHITYVEVPDSGKLEFRFLKDGDPEQVLCPDEPDCARRTAPMLGPAKDLSNSWVVHAPPRQDVRIELLITGGRRSVMWLVGRGVGG
mmetsp:Transcript_120112/g.299623  ORF Transcript_120112/g.299623 Transcript_120112/m.299623 type:complete len:960 (+) Transcript_120112:115-2994(+)